MPVGLEHSFPLASWAQMTRESPLQVALARAASPEILSLSLGLPDPGLFPTALLGEATARVLGSNNCVLQYSLPLQKLKLAVCRLMADRGVECSPDQIFLTMGAQQGLSLLMRLLLDPGATVLEETFSYTGFQQAAEPYLPKVITIPSDVNVGIDLDALEEILSSDVRPALLYVMADGHNPLGTSMPIANRERLAYLAREYRLPVVEDDPYGFLEYDGTPLPPIRKWEQNWVYYVGSFSKLLAPALRVGWLVVPSALMSTLAVIKEGSDINTNSLAQWIVAEFLEMGLLAPHLGCLRREYGARRTAMNTALFAEVRAWCRWRSPSAGIFFWVELPPGMIAADVLKQALELERVAFLPSEAFSRGRRTDGIRLNFSRCNPELITDGVRRIGRVIRQWG